MGVKKLLWVVMIVTKVGASFRVLRSRVFAFRSRWNGQEGRSLNQKGKQ